MSCHIPLRKKLIQHCSPFLITTPLLLTLFCFGEYNGEPPDNGVGIQVEIIPSKEKESSEREFTIGDTINIRLTVLAVAPLNAISYGILYHDDAKLSEDDYLSVKDSLIEEDIKRSTTTYLTCKQPGNAYLVAVAKSKDREDFDTLHLTITENGDDNTAPNISLTPCHTYATPSLPCSVIRTVIISLQIHQITLRPRSA